ncbi:hypothetical protein [Roseateles sp.]|uniref:hypothetical protein n=1 Tax=Roseateles sp. TaxID=1971397 RepID=UPI003BA9B747
MYNLGESISEHCIHSLGDAAYTTPLQQSAVLPDRRQGGHVMSIHYRFTDHESIFVWCGDDWIEIRLPGGGGGTTAGPSPTAPDLSDPSTGARPIKVPEDQPTIAPEPPIPPSTMFIGMIGSRGQPPSLLVRTPEPAAGGDRVRSVRRSTLAALQAEVEWGVSRSFFRHSGVRIVEVDVSKIAPPQQRALADIQRLLQDWGPAPGVAGLGVQDEDE